MTIHPAILLERTPAYPATPLDHNTAAQAVPIGEWLL